MPGGGLVVGGSASIDQSIPNTTIIQQSTDRAIIRWDSFDVGPTQHVDFQQPSASAITVNRIADTKASQIDGSITANGNIMLLNPNGIVFGASSRVDVSGLIAATSDLEDDAAFMAGGDVKLTRPGKPDAAIINNGTINIGQAGLGGLVAPHVENNGVIRAQLGKIALASGDIATVDFAGDGLIKVEVSDAVSTQLVKNTGTLSASGGQVLVTAAQARNIVDSLIINEGTIEADTLGVQTGSITIVGKTSGLQNTGTIRANGSLTANAGRITIEAQQVALGGSITADGKNGGTIAIKARTLSMADTISAKGLDGDGGTITTDSEGETWVTSTSRISVDGTRDGGAIRSITAINYVSSGLYTAIGGTGHGGNIDISGGGVKFLTALIDASGHKAGGRVRLGGEYQGGKNLPVDEMPNAIIMTLDRGTRVRADGEDDDSDGGNIIVWSDKDTLVLGTLSATPGLTSGNGGFIEISSGDVLNYGATVTTGRDTRAGTLLLDPKNIIIAGSSFNATAIIMGRGYSAPNVDMTQVNDSRGFADTNSVSVDGNRMAVVLSNTHGLNDVAPASGSVMLYSFTDGAFSGGVLESIIGKGYTGGKNIDLTVLGTSDQLRSVSLDGNQLAIGARYDDGALNNRGNAGAVHLLTFTDAAFNGGTLRGTIGDGYSGSRSYGVTGLSGNDNMGFAISLDNNRLAVGVLSGDGFNNTRVNVGEVMLFSFDDNTFLNPVLQGIIGSGFVGTKDINITLDDSDSFGASLSLSGNLLVVGASSGDGADNSIGAAGEVYMFSFTDALFSGGVHEGTIGNGYTGGKNINISLDTNDVFGNGLALEGNRLIIGSPGDDGYGNASANSGAVFMYSFSGANFAGATLEGAIGNNYGTLGGKNVSRSNEAATGDSFGRAVAIDGTRLLVAASTDDGVSNLNPDQGAVHFYTFSDTSFNGLTYQGSLGTAYSGGKNVDLGFNTSPDTGTTEYGISLSDNRIAIGAVLDDGFGDSAYDTGAVYLYSFLSDAFDGAVLEGIIGSGYTGGKNVNIASSLGAGDRFGAAVSLDGNRLVVGSPYDDGVTNASGNAGAVYLFTFTDSAFNGGTLQARMGHNYATLGGKNYSLSGIGSSDLFGSSVSLDGNRLAIGAGRDDGSGNTRSDSGAVYLFTFADSSFTTPTLQATIGYGYTGGKNFNLTNLDSGDFFGDLASVSLDGNRLAVGAQRDDGAANDRSNSGAVYLFSFADSSFATPTLQSTIGHGYTGGKNYNLTLDVDDNMSPVALEGTTLAIGVPGDDNANNSERSNGAVRIFSFNDLTFTTPVLSLTIGQLYTGGKNISANGYANTDDFFGRTLDLNQGTLIASSTGNDGFSDYFTTSGGVSIFRGNSYAPSSGATFTNLSSTTIGITPGNLVALLSTPQNVILQASNDIFVDDDIIVNNPSGNGGTLTLQAGRSILISANITTDNGNLNIYANEDLSTGVVNAQRDAGAASITMAAGKTINAGTGTVNLRLEDGTGKTNRTSGTITLGDITAGTIIAQTVDATASIIVNGILSASDSGTAITLAAGKDFINNYGAGALSTSAGRWLIYSDHNILNTLGGITAGFTQNNCIYGSCSVPGSGNGLLYEYSPNLLSISVNTSRAYGDANPDSASLQSLFVYKGFQGSDSVSVLDMLPSISVAGSATATAGAGTTHAITLTGGSDDFYSYYLLDPSLLTITKRSAVATLNSPLTKTYGDANPSPTAGGFSVTNLVNGDLAATILTSITLNFGAIGNGTAAGTYSGITASLPHANYDISFAPVDLTINKRDITANWTGTLTRAYGDANPNVTTSNFTYTGLVNGDTGTAITASGNYGSTTSSSNVGSYTVSGNFSAANYNITNTPTTTLSITKRNITAAVGNSSRAYGDANPTLNWSNVTWTNLANSENGSVLDAFTLASPTALANSNAGTSHNITLSGFSDNNYNLTSSTAGTLSIIKRDITATVNDASRAYGDANPSLNWSNVTWSNLANSETGSVIDALTLAAATANATSNAGTTHNIALSGFSDNNYNLTGSTAGMLTITKRNVTAGWNSPLTRVYGDANPTVPASNFTYSSLVNGDTESAITATPTYGTTTALTDVGTYGVGATFASTNYNVTNAPTSTITITKRDITAAVGSTSRAYGDANPTLNWSNVVWTNLANGENGSVIDGLTLAAATATATSNAGTTHNITLGGFSDNNYNLTSSTAGTLTITKRNVTAAWNAPLSRIYGDSNPAVSSTNFTYTGLVNGDGNSALTALADYGSIDAFSNAGSYTVGVNFSGNNYNVTNAPTTTLTIDKRNVTAVWNGAISRIYGDSNPAVSSANFTYTGLVNGDSNAAINASTNYGGTNATSNVGTYTINGQFSATNYAVSGGANGQLIINKAPISLTVNNATRSAQAANPDFGYTLIGLRNGDSVGVLNNVLLATTANSTSPAGRYAITASGGVAVNYYVSSYVDGVLTISSSNEIPATVNHTLSNATNSLHVPNYYTITMPVVLDSTLMPAQWLTQAMFNEIPILPDNGFNASNPSLPLVSISNKLATILLVNEI